MEDGSQQHCLAIRQNIAPRAQREKIQASEALIAIMGFNRRQTLLDGAVSVAGLVAATSRAT
jgi:hypothetical protein